MIYKMKSCGSGVVETEQAQELKSLFRTELAEPTFHHLLRCLICPWISTLKALWHGWGPRFSVTPEGSLWHFARPSCWVLTAVGTRITDLIHPHAYPRVNQKQLHWFLWHSAHPAPNGAIHKNPTNFPWGSVDMALALGGRSQPSGVILWMGGKNQPSGFSFLILSMLPGLTMLIINPQAWNSLLLLFCVAATTEKKKAAKNAGDLSWLPMSTLHNLWDLNKGGG